jgi:hypothetical protein
MIFCISTTVTVTAAFIISSYMHKHNWWPANVQWRRWFVYHVQHHVADCGRFAAVNEVRRTSVVLGIAGSSRAVSQVAVGRRPREATDVSQLTDQHG